MNEGDERRADVSKNDHHTPWKRLEEFWDRIQVGRQGSYSVERLELLNHYCKTTSKTRVFLVCVLTPLPVLITAVLLECFPLRSPSEGWAANWMFWIRLSVMVFILSVAGFSQMNDFIPGYNLPISKMVVAALGICIIQSGTYLLEGVVFGFPVPFMWQLGAITMAVYAPTVTRLVFGAGLFAKGSLLWLHHERFQRSFFVHLALTGIYPFYKALYDIIPQTYRGTVLFALPIWKFAAKRFVVHATRDLEDFIPEIVAFSVDFFSALFLSVCMSTSSSIYLTGLFIMTDVGQSFLEFREIRNNAATLSLVLRHLRSKSDGPGNKEHDLLKIILDVSRNPSAFQVASLDGARLWSNPRNVLPEPLDNRMQALGASGIYGSKGHPSNREASVASTASYRKCPAWWDYQRISVVPSPVQPDTNAKGKIIGLSKAQSSSKYLGQGKRSKELVLQGLQLLFHCEYLALVEYIECVVPLIFVIYKSVLEQLPNIIFYPGGGGNWSMTAVVNLLVFAILEIGSLALLHAFLQHKLAFPPFYQLAFVLEAQFYPVQANLFLETIFLLQYQLEHLGKDRKYSRLFEVTEVLRSTY
ncbi:unnamed protein product [Phytophthora fragariaefolia]|uniref:Unnamed protein product n=1 Tax=Phytophthora fragariaefolia TaxID=1490495 RepID=A0A9W6X036_9STRA|nr:unnamed protein product [Phytophthora fragariaefolia]